MMSKWRWWLSQFSEKLWVIAVFYAILGVATAILAGTVGPLLPPDLGEKLGAGAVETVLTILATSMLSVVTFSLGVMVQAFANAARAVTPRTATLLQADRTTQRVLSTFLGAFLFSLIGIIALKSGVYTDNDRVVLFGAAILVVVIVVVSILRWIAHLTVFGLMADTIAKVEKAAEEAIRRRQDVPYLGGHRFEGPVPPDAQAVCADQIGYVCNLDMTTLQAAAEAGNLRIYVAAMPGAFVHPKEPLLWVQGPAGPIRQDLRDAFTIDHRRTFDQDPRFGLAVLTEIAERALSPAVNDPGTAIDILGRAVRLLAPLADPPEAELTYPQVWVPPLRIADMFEDVFPAIARDGRGFFSVQLRLQKTLLALTRIAPAVFGAIATDHSAQGLERCKNAMLPGEWERLSAVATDIADLANPGKPRPI